MIDLPVELIQEIVAALSTPEYPLQFGHKADVRRALVQLLLVNHALLDIVKPILYSTIIISSRHELHAFLSTSFGLRSLTTSLWLRNFSGRFFEAAELIRVLGPSLRRLALDVPGNELDASSSVREALRCCTRLTDFTRSGYSPMQVLQPYPFWPDWMGLRRLALDGPFVNDRFISHIKQLPHLTHLALIEPRWQYSADGTEAAVFKCLLLTSDWQLLLIYCQPTQPNLNSLKRLKKLINFEYLRRRLQVHYMVTEESVTGMACIRHHIGEGNFFNFEPQKLLVSLADTRGSNQSDIACRAQLFTSGFSRHGAPSHDIVEIY